MRGSTPLLPPNIFGDLMTELQIRKENDMNICPTLERLVLDLHKSREIANKHLANLRYARKKIGILEMEIRNLKEQLRVEREFKKLTRKDDAK